VGCLAAWRLPSADENFKPPQAVASQSKASIRVGKECCMRSRALLVQGILPTACHRSSRQSYSLVIYNNALCVPATLVHEPLTTASPIYPPPSVTVSCYDSSPHPDIATQNSIFQLVTQIRPCRPLIQSLCHDSFPRRRASSLKADANQ
jgi:hypothetical protein